MLSLKTRNAFGINMILNANPLFYVGINGSIPSIWIQVHYIHRYQQSKMVIPVILNIIYMKLNNLEMRFLRILFIRNYLDHIMYILILTSKCARCFRKQYTSCSKMISSLISSHEVNLILHFVYLLITIKMKPKLIALSIYAWGCITYWYAISNIFTWLITGWFILNVIINM